MVRGKKAVAGIDLAGSERKWTGICIFSKSVFITRLKSDDEIIAMLKRYKPVVVAIDAPLTFTGKPFRKCDRKLMREGVRMLPLTLPGMRELAKRSIRLKNALEKIGCNVIETYPYPLRGEIEAPQNLTRDEKDAYLCAYVALRYLEGNFKEYKNDDGRIILIPPQRSSDL